MGNAQVNPTRATVYVGNYPMTYEQNQIVTNINGDVYISSKSEDAVFDVSNVPLWTTYFCGSGIGIANQGINIYPNPTSGLINISFYSNVDNSILIQCFNSLGQTALEQKIGVNLGLVNSTLDIGSLATGVYIIRVQNGDNPQSFKIIKN